MENVKRKMSEGKEYHTREVLSCPFHLLVYKIECFVRARMADKLVHKILKRGHSNWLESSHNIFIRYRPKHIYRSTIMSPLTLVCSKPT